MEVGNSDESDIDSNDGDLGGEKLISSIGDV